MAEFIPVAEGEKLAENRILARPRSAISAAITGNCL
jgi:hypothetical protein